jgi:hypothetical protein
MPKVTAKKVNTVNEKKFPGMLGKMLVRCHSKKMTAKATATKLNESAAARKIGKKYTTMNIAATYGHWNR